MVACQHFRAVTGVGDTLLDEYSTPVETAPMPSLPDMSGFGGSGGTPSIDMSGLGQLARHGVERPDAEPRATPGDAAGLLTRRHPHPDSEEVPPCTPAPRRRCREAAAPDRVAPPDDARPDHRPGADPVARPLARLAGRRSRAPRRAEASSRASPRPPAARSPSRSSPPAAASASPTSGRSRTAPSAA